jgi:hypothetical protein
MSEREKDPSCCPTGPAKAQLLTRGLFTKLTHCQKQPKRGTVGGERNNQSDKTLKKGKKGKTNTLEPFRAQRDY